MDVVSKMMKLQRYTLMLLRRRRYAAMLLLLMTGVIGILIATQQTLKTVSNVYFAWPLEVKPELLIYDYKHGKQMKLLNRFHYNYTIKPVDFCQGTTAKFLTILIKTRVTEYKTRTVLRRTWIKDINNDNHLQYAFVLGVCPEDDLVCDLDIQTESSRYGDIIQADFTESYQNNTVKVIMMFRYMYEHCPSGSSYILIIDGDYAVNIKHLVREVKNLNVTTGVFAGRIWHAKPFRDHNHKHYRSVSDYPYTFYPDFIAAGAMVLSSDVVSNFFVLSHYTKYFPFDDIFLAIMAKKLNITPTQLGHKLPSFYVPQATDPKNKELIGSHRFGKLDEVEYIYKTFQQAVF